jgi:CheY-like chemotaxis protein
VDDDATVRTAIQRVLTKAGFAVNAAIEARSAMEPLRGGNAFDVIVTDLTMPEINGIEFMRLVRERDLDLSCINWRWSNGERSSL